MCTIKIPNYAFFSDNENKLCPDEIIVFMYLFRYRNVDDEILTTINVLNEKFKFQKGNDRKNRPYIKTILLSLQFKKYLTTTINDSTGSDDLITGIIINEEKGYCGVDSSIFDEIVNDNELFEAKLKLFLYSFIHCYGKSGRKIQYEKLSIICSYFDSTKKHSVSTIQQMINEMDGKYIFRFSGERAEGEVEQDANTYYTELKGEKILAYQKHVNMKAEAKRKRRKPDEVIDTTLGGLMVSELKQYIKYSNWRKENSQIKGGYELLTYSDYEIYRISIDEGIDYNFNKLNKKSIETLKQSPELYDYDWDEWEQQYLIEQQNIKIWKVEGKNE